MDALRVNLCPKFTVKSVLFVISITQVIVFATELFLGGVMPNALLAANPHTLELMGQKNPYRMRYTWEVYRYFVPIFLHGDLGHLCCNVIAQLMIGSNLEPDIGSCAFFALYMLSGIGGIIFSALCTDVPSMGASTAVYGLSGSYVAFIILNYEYLANRRDKLCQVIMFLVLAVLLTAMLGPEKIDVLGHLGGFLTGIICGMWLLPSLEINSIQKADRAKTFASVAKVATAIFMVGMLVLFYTCRTPADVVGDGAIQLTPTEVSGATTTEVDQDETTPMPPSDEAGDVEDDDGALLAQTQVNAEDDEYFTFLAQTERAEVGGADESSLW